MVCNCAESTSVTIPELNIHRNEDVHTRMDAHLQKRKTSRMQMCRCELQVQNVKHARVHTCNPSGLNRCIHAPVH